MGIHKIPHTTYFPKRQAEDEKKTECKPTEHCSQFARMDVIKNRFCRRVIENRM
jgi:hypothetical protein